MRRARASKWRACVGVIAAGVLAASAAPALAGTQSCGWSGAGRGVPGDWSGVLPQGSDVNAHILLGEGGASYWQAWNIPIPRGGYLEFHGWFPHARYTSYTTYGDGLKSIDGLADSSIVPDRGSSNPFTPGADRTVAQREYTVKLVAGGPPASGREPNTLYNDSPDGTKSGGSNARVSLRIYAPDIGTGRQGGVPLPEITSVGADGTRSKMGECTDPGIPDPGAYETISNSGSGEPLPATGIGAQDPPVWHRFTNVESSLVESVGGDPTLTDERFPEGGWGDTPDNRYVSTRYSSKYGQVLAFRAKAPTFPRTRNGEPVMGSGQVRFWSMCTYGHSTSWYGCRQDDEFPVDAAGFYTVVISTAAARPRNATHACGYLWLPAGPEPQAIVILRNTLADPSFAEAIQRIGPRGTEAKTMREYYPRGTYYARTIDFERMGCQPSTG